jgi:hypothetical protein
MTFTVVQTKQNGLSKKSSKTTRHACCHSTQCLSVSTHLNVAEDRWLGRRPQRCQGNLSDGFRDVQWEHEERLHGPVAILLNPYEPNRLKELEGVLRNANTLLQCAHPKYYEELKPKQHITEPRHSLSTWHVQRQICGIGSEPKGRSGFI